MKKLLLLSLFAIGGCTHSIHMVHTDGFDGAMPNIEKANMVEARAEQEVVLWFAYDTNYVNRAHEALLAQCDGNIQAVSTQFSTSHNFLHWTNKILMTGICVQP